MTKKVKQNELKLESIVKQSKGLNEWSTYVVDEVTNTVIKYKKEFSELKISELVNELHAHILKDIETKKGFFVDDETFMIYINFLMIKHFSHLGEAMKTNTIEENVIYIEHLGATGYFRLFFNEIFPPKEQVKVYQMVRERADIIDKITEASAEMKAKASTLPSKSKMDEMVKEALKLQEQNK